jgi:hypothetical protein
MKISATTFDADQSSQKVLLTKGPPGFHNSPATVSAFAASISLAVSSRSATVRYEPGETPSRW